MTRLLCLRSRFLSRACAATFAALYALFASGAAFGALDLACVKLEAPPCAPATAGSEGSAKEGCCCGHEHAAGTTCCCSSKAEAAPVAGFSFTAAARCANPDSGSHDGMTRVSPHVADETLSAPSISFAPAAEPRALPLVSRPTAPPEKVPLAH